MPEHTSFLSYLLALFPGLSHNTEILGKMLMSGQPVGEHHVESFVMSLLVMVIIVALALLIRSKMVQTNKAVVPEAKLTLRTFVEVFLGAFYDLACDIMGAKRAKQFFPVIGTCAIFIFFSNLMGLIPGMGPPTSSFNITMGCALFVTVLFNYYGLRENGFGYIKHLWGPNLGIPGIPVNLLIFTIETLTMVVIRPVTLGIRLMINMAVDHLIGSIFLGLVALFLPIPALFLGILVVVVQTIVFCLLTCIYIGLATEHEEHHEGAVHH